MPRFEELRDAARPTRCWRDSVAGELISSEIEIRSGRGSDFAAAISAQRDRRRRLFALAADRGVALGATGTHPWADYREQHIIDTEHYHRVEEGLKYVAWRNNTFSCTSTWASGAPTGRCSCATGCARCCRCCWRSRPTRRSSTAGTRACTARARRSSPRAFRGAACRMRSAAGRHSPTTSTSSSDPLDRRVHPGVVVDPPALLVRHGRGANLRCADDRHRVRGAGRAHRRVCGPSGARPRRRRPVRRSAAALIEENVWRAIRYGLDGELLDLDRAEPYPASEAVDRLLNWSAPVRSELGIEVALPSLNGAQRQRRMTAAA